MNDWYFLLNKPPLTPQAWIFSPVWAFLYITIIISFVVYASKLTLKQKKYGYIFFWLQILFNLLWTPAFFMLKSPLSGLVIILILDILVILTITEFYRISKFAASLLIPYLLWILFATYLNIGFVVLN